MSKTKHHCRACGGGFCDKCSLKSMPVPWRGWGDSPVRVCNGCYKQHREPENHERIKSELSIYQPDCASEHETKISGSMVAQTQDREYSSDSANVTARFLSEVVCSAIGVVADTVSYPKDLIVESARPVYWIPDVKIKSCTHCNVEFSARDSKHHCRACGQGFCENCSSKQLPVPSRGWDYPVRVCDSCATRNDL